MGLLAFVETIGDDDGIFTAFFDSKKESLSSEGGGAQTSNFSLLGSLYGLI